VTAKWEKKPPYEGPVHQGCLNCPPVHTTAPMDMIIAVGFGVAAIIKDEEIIYMEGRIDDCFRTLAEFEEMAKEDPDHDWRALLDGPMRYRLYQRHGEGEWVLIESGPGFV
jgi:hypothetical protein